MSTDVGSPVPSAENLLSSAEAITSPVFVQEKTYAQVVAKTILEVQEISNPPQQSVSMIEQAMRESQEMNQSLLESAFRGRGVVINQKG